MSTNVPEWAWKVELAHTDLYQEEGIIAHSVQSTCTHHSFNKISEILVKILCA